MNKIYKDLKESEYIFTFYDFKFYFSSKFYFNKFLKEYDSYIKNEIDKLKISFKCDVVANSPLLLLLYKRIEKRGFRVLYKGIELKDYYISISIISLD